jgi:hypothetical protein
VGYQKIGKFPFLGCATPQLLDGDLMTRFLTKEARILLLEFLLSHMKSARLTASHRLKRESQERLEKRKVKILQIRFSKSFSTYF